MCSPSWFHQRHGSDETYDLSVYENDGKLNLLLLHMSRILNSNAFP